MNLFHWLTGTPSGSVIFIILGFVVVLFFYTVPMWLAYTLNSKYRFGITLVNLVFGWTVVGWIVALVWALVSARDISFDGENSDGNEEVP